MILMYHKVHPEKKTMWWVDCDSFYRQMASLVGKKVVYLDDYDAEDPSHVVITFDGVYQNVLQFAFPILQHFGYCFELFVTGDYIGTGNGFDTVEPHAMFASHGELSSLVGGGGRLQWHTKSHLDLLHVHDRTIIKRELAVPEILNSLDAKSFRWFAYPNGNFNDYVIEEVSACFNGAVSCIQGNDLDRYRLNRMTVTSETILTSRRISVVVPSYNYGCYLPDAVESVLRQTVVPDEILIADDASEDNTREVAEFYVENSSGIVKYVRNEKNLGPIGNFNRAIKMTTGDYVCLLGADNRFLSNYIELCSRTLDQDNRIGIAYTDYALFGKRAEVVYDKYRDELKAGRKEDFFCIKFPEFEGISIDYLRRQNIMHGSSMFRRQAYDDVGGYRAENLMPEDQNLFIRIITSGWFAKKVKGTWLEYRQHSADQLNESVIAQQQLQFYKRKCKELERRLSVINRSRLVKYLILLSDYSYHGFIKIKEKIKNIVCKISSLSASK